MRSMYAGARCTSSVTVKTCIPEAFMAVANESDFSAKAFIDTIAKELTEVNCWC